MQYDNPVSSSDLLATLTAESANLSDSTIAAINSLLNLDNAETVAVAGITGSTVQLPESGAASIVQGTVEGVKGDTVVVDLAAAEAAGASVYHLQSDANLVVNLQGQAAAPAADVQAFAALAAVDTSAIELVVTTGNEPLVALHIALTPVTKMNAARLKSPWENSATQQNTIAAGQMA